MNYRVVEVDDLHSTDADGRKQWLHGHIRYAECDIRVASDQCDARKIITLCHEVVHGILESAGHDDRAFEPFIRALGFGLVEFIRDNPELIALIQQERNDDGNGYDDRPSPALDE